MAEGVFARAVIKVPGNSPSDYSGEAVEAWFKNMCPGG